MVRVKRRKSTIVPKKDLASGEPTGRGPLRENGEKKPWRPLKSCLRELLAEQLPSGMTRGEFVMNTLVNLAKAGDLRAIDMILDRVEGKPGPDTSGHETSEEKARALIRDLQEMEMVNSGGSYDTE